MSRLSSCGAFLPFTNRFFGLSFGLALGLTLSMILSMTSAPMWAQGSPKSAVGARIQHVAVHGSGARTEVEIETSGATVTPATQVITGPDRIIVDFPGALPSEELRALVLKENSGALKGVRAGLFANKPPVTRVVLDLAEPQSFHIVTTQASASRSEIVVKLGAAEAGSSTQASASQTSTPQSATSQTSTLQGSVGERLAAERAAKQRPVEATRAKSSSEKPNVAQANAAKPKMTVVTALRPDSPNVTIVRTPRLQNALLAAGTKTAGTTVAPTRMSAPVATSSPAIAPTANSPAASVPVASAAALPPAEALATVTFSNGLLSIHAQKSTLAQVLFEVQQKTQAEIAIPAGAEQEQVISDLGPAPAREVLAQLLNGSPYNFIFVGNENNLQRVILTRRDPNEF